MSLEQPNECKYSFKPLTTDRPAATLGGHLPPGRQAQTVAEPGLSIIGERGSTERSGPLSPAIGDRAMGAELVDSLRPSMIP